MARTLAQAVITILIAFIIAYLLIIATAESQQIPPITPSVYDSRLEELDRQAIEEAYKKHIMLLFDGWMKDPSNQPYRAIIGAREAREAFIGSMTEIDKRKR